MAGGWNFTIDDSSSYITYHPSEDTGLGNETSLGWVPYWTGSGGFLSASSANNYGKAASGQSLHITTLEGASLAFEYRGHAFCLYGTSNGTFDVSVDTNIVTNLTQTTDGVLYCQDGLTSDVHYVNLTAHFVPNTGQQLRFDYADVTYDFSTGTTSPTEVVYNNTNASALQYTGKWGTVSIPGAPSTTLSAPLHNTTFYGASASLNFTGEAVAVYGFRDYGNWLYNITLDEQQYQYNGSTVWELTNSLLFFRAGLDPNVAHSIEIMNDADESYYKFYLNSISVFRTNSTSTATPTMLPHTTTHTGAIIGGVVGGLGGLLLICGLVIWLLRRRPSPYSDISPFTASAEPDHQANTLTKSSSSLQPVDNANRARGFTGKRAAHAEPLVTAQVPQAHPVSTPPSGAIIATGQAEATESASAARPDTSRSSASAPSDAQPVIVDRIIALLAERIDRRTLPDRDADDAPPRYPESAV